MSGNEPAEWQGRVVGRTLQDARRRSIDRGARFIRAAAKVLERNNGSLTVQEVADETGQSLKTLYQCFASKDDLLLAVFEEAMATYADMIRAAIAGVDEVVARIAAALIASVRLAELHDNAGLDRGLSVLRQQLSHADPELLAQSQAPVTLLFREIVENAHPAMATAMTVDEATYLIVSLRAAFVSSIALGNEFTASMPAVIDLSGFVLGGLGLPRPRTWHEAVEARTEISVSRRPILRVLARARR